MFLSDNYLLAWCLYLISAGLVTWVMWRFTSLLKPVGARTVLRVLLVTLWIVPAKVDPQMEYWAPAFITVLLETVTISVEAGLARLWPLLWAMLIATGLSLAWHLRSWIK